MRMGPVGIIWVSMGALSVHETSWYLLGEYGGIRVRMGYLGARVSSWVHMGTFGCAW